eukprot:sb/3478298/
MYSDASRQYTHPGVTFQFVLLTFKPLSQSTTIITIKVHTAILKPWLEQLYLPILIFWHFSVKKTRDITHLQVLIFIIRWEAHVLGLFQFLFVLLWGIGDRL